MSTERPVLLVDIDGVLNVYAVDECPEGYSEFELFPDDEEPARLCPLHGEWLDELGEQFDLAWASAWGADAHRVLGPILGLEEFAFVPMPAIPFPPAEKVPAVAAFVGDRPTAWLDDIITPEARAWARERPVPTLLIAVDHRTGLQRRHVENLMIWRSLAGTRDGWRPVLGSGAECAHPSWDVDTPDAQPADRGTASSPSTEWSLRRAWSAMNGLESS